MVTLGVSLAAVVVGIAPGTWASASARGGHAAPAAAGTITTVAGGVGGPGLGTQVSVNALGVAASGDHLYLADGVVQEVDSHGRLTTPVGDLGQPGEITNGSPSAGANLSAGAVAIAPNGDLVIADTEANQVLVAAVRSGRYCGQAMTAGDIYVVAGDGSQGYSGGGTPGRSAELNEPEGVAVDGAGNVLIADTYDNRVQVVADHSGTFYGRPMKVGRIYSLAGNGYARFRGDGGPAGKSALDEPSAVAVDGAGNVLIADAGNGRVRVVAATTGTLYGQPVTAGDIYTVAGNGTSTPNPGGPGTQSGLGDPEGVAADHAGNLLIADAGLDEVDVVAAATGTYYGQPMTAGYLYVLPISAVGLRNGGSVPAAGLVFSGVAVDGAGNVVIAAGTYAAVFAVQAGNSYGWTMTAGDTYAVAGNGQFAFSGDRGPALKAQFNSPEQVAADASGNVLVADAENNRVRIVAASTGTFYGRPMTAGDVYTLAGGGTQSPGDGLPAAHVALNFPQAIAVDQSGNVLIADSEDGRIRAVAASTGTFYGQAMTAGHIYTIAGGGDGGDSGPATDATLGGPNGVAVSASGNLVIADTADCMIDVVPSSTGTFYGLPMTAGDLYRVAGNGACVYQGDGGPARKASVNYPYGVAVDAAGNIVIADTYDSRVRVVAGSSGTFYGQSMTAGDIYTVAGSGLSGDVHAPTSVTVDSAGNVLIAAAGDSQVKVLAAESGTFYGVTMTAGGLYVVAGNGSSGYSGDGGPATSAELHPEGVALDGPNLLIADNLSGRVRMVSG